MMCQQVMDCRRNPPSDFISHLNSHGMWCEFAWFLNPCTHFGLINFVFSSSHLRYESSSHIGVKKYGANFPRTLIITWLKSMVSMNDEWPLSELWEGLLPCLVYNAYHQSNKHHLQCPPQANVAITRQKKWWPLTSIRLEIGHAWWSLQGLGMEKVTWKVCHDADTWAEGPWCCACVLLLPCMPVACICYLPPPFKQPMESDHGMRYLRALCHWPELSWTCLQPEEIR